MSHPATTGDYQKAKFIFSSWGITILIIPVCIALLSGDLGLLTNGRLFEEIGVVIIYEIAFSLPCLILFIIAVNLIVKFSPGPAAVKRSTCVAIIMLSVLFWIVVWSLLGGGTRDSQMRLIMLGLAVLTFLPTCIMAYIMDWTPKTVPISNWDDVLDN